MRTWAPLLAILSACCAQSAEAPMVACAGSRNVLTLELNAIRPQGGPERSVRNLHIIEAGSVFRYKPLQLPVDVDKEARVALLLAPVPTAGGNTALSWMDMKPATVAGEWKTPFRVGLMVLLFGPRGLDEKRVTNLLAREEELFFSLADYAAQTEELEATMDYMEAVEEEEESRLQAGAATPTEQAIFALLRAISPTAAAFTPVGAGKRVGPASTMGKASSTFFSTAGDFVPGGGILPEVKNMLFPDTEFRAAYVQPLKERSLGLCAQRNVPKTRNRIAYVWARRIPDAAMPGLTLSGEVHLPLGLRSPLPIRGESALQARLAADVRDWALQPAAGGPAIPVRLWPSITGSGYQLDLTGDRYKPGRYTLQGSWDYETLVVKGAMFLHALGDLAGAQLSADSAARLVEGSGPVTARLEGADFQFVEQVSWRRSGRPAASARKLDFYLPKGSRRGPQDSLEVDLDTSRLSAGDYILRVEQAGGAAREIAVRVFQSLPEIANLPLRVNAGVREQRVTLRGRHLERLEKLEGDGLRVELDRPAVDAGELRERHARIAFANPPAQGASLALRFQATGLARAASLANALQVAGPRPRITKVELSLPAGLGVELQEKELPSGSFVTAAMQVEGATQLRAVSVRCTDPARQLRVLQMKPGEQSESGRLVTIGPDRLLLSFDPGAVGQPGCQAGLVVEDAGAGESEPAALGRVLRLPHIVQFRLSAERTADSSYAGELEGENLEVVEKTGWDPAQGLAVNGLPQPIAGQGSKQVLKITMPWPPPQPKAPLFIWLRGEQAGRKTAARY